MDNFTNKNSRQKRARFSLDGISPNNSSRPQSSSSIDFDRPASSVTKGRLENRVLDDFRRNEGFTVAQNSQISQRPVSATPPKPTITPKRKNLFGKKQQKPRLDGIQRKDKKAIRRKRLKIAATSCFALILIAALGYGYLRNIFGDGGGATALQENVDPSQLRGEGDGRVNILLMGRGGSGAEAPDLTDTLMVVSIDPINKEAGIVSIPRDLYVTVPDVGSMKINEVFYTGKQQVLNNSSSVNDEVKKQAEDKGYELAKSSVESVLGIPIHYRSIVDFKGFEKAIDTVGGVEVNVPKDVNEQMLLNGQPYSLDVDKGLKHFDGFEALAYSRSRYTSENGDFDRAERQRLIVMALKDKVLSTDTFSNPAKVAQLLDNFDENVETDFSLSELNRLREIFKEVDSSKIESLGMSKPPHDYLITTSIGDLSVVLPKAGAGNYGEIHRYIRNTLRDGYLKSENANVMILNGTDSPGLATDKAEELRSYGYNIGTVDNAPGGKRYTHTTVVDLRDGNKKYTKRYLEQRFGTIAVSSLPDGSIQPGNADFVIILGSDINSGR